MKDFKLIKKMIHAHKQAMGKQPAQGFSLVELLVTMTVFFFIMMGVYVMIDHYSNATKTEQARMTIQQENRFINAVFLEELKDAGAILTLAHTGGFLKDPPFFNGIFPLNNVNYPDGIIIATGDPEAVTRLTADFSSGGAVLNVSTVVPPASLVDAAEYPPWAKDDIGILLSKDGYYVFKVISVDSATNTITMRDWSKPVYYSGQLNTNNYQDTPIGTSGSGLSYAEGTMVVRLNNFAIYLFKDSWSKDFQRQIRQLYRVTDTMGDANVLADGSNAEMGIVSESIWDMQISYTAFDNFASVTRSTTPDPNHQYFNNGSSTSTLDELLSDMRSRFLKQIDVSMITLTDPFGGSGETEKAYLQLGDRQAPDTLPDGKFGIKVTSFVVEPRNFNIIL